MNVYDDFLYMTIAAWCFLQTVLLWRHTDRFAVKQIFSSFYLLLLKSVYSIQFKVTFTV